MSINIDDTDMMRVKQINHLAVSLYDITKGVELLSKTKADIIQEILDEMQELLDSCINDRLEREKK